MEISLLKLFIDWLSVLIITLVSSFNIGSYRNKSIMNVDNLNYEKNAIVLNEIVNYKTEYVYNSDRPSDSEPIVLNPGEYGLVYRYSDGEIRELKKSKNRVIEIGTAKITKYSGRLTAYTPYCEGCSSAGNVACSVKGKKYSLKRDGQYYVDSEYGKIRIVAAALTVFPCGTIVTIDNGKFPVFNAIVLDTGGSMRQAIKNGIVWMDLAYSNKDDECIRQAGSKNVSFVIRRWGW